MQTYDISALKILVLEKHILIRNLLTEVFREFGIPTVQSTADPVVAYEMFAEFPVDVILSDWCSGLDGMAFLNRMRKDPASANPFVPVIVITANTELKHVCTARDTGMTEFLAKPVSAKMIYSRIVSIIESTRPYVRCSQFFGPDRRRRAADGFIGQNRRDVSVLH